MAGAPPPPGAPAFILFSTSENRMSALLPASGAMKAQVPARRFPGSSTAGEVRDEVHLASAKAESCLLTGGLNRPRSTCPCCGQEWAGRDAFEDMLDDLPPKARKAVRLIAMRPGISGSTLASLVYADDASGGPEDARKVINVHLHKARSKMKRYGFDVAGRIRGGLTGYRLIRLEAA